MSEIVDKVAKLLSLAAEDSGATDAERDNAADRAQRLMTEHRISMADVNVAQGKTRSGADIVMKRIWAMPSHMRNRWFFQLATSIAFVNDAEAVMWGEYGKPGDVTIALVGEQDTIDFVAHLVNFIRPQIDRLAVDELVKEAEIRISMGRPFGDEEVTDYGTGICMGAVERITTRLMAAKQSAGPGTELVLSTQAAIKDFYGDNPPERKETETNVNLWALMRGSDRGGSIDLNPDNKLAGDRLAITQGDK